MEYDDCTQLKKSNLKPNICLIASIAVRISVKVIQEKGQLIIVCLSDPTPSTRQKAPKNPKDVFAQTRNSSFSVIKD